MQIRCERLEVRLEESELARQRERQQLERERQALEAVVDNALFAAGGAPIFDPTAARFQPRRLEQQHAEAATAGRPGALTMAEWRQRVERLDQERAERDRRAQMAEELEALARERQAAGKEA